ncbi:MAG: hypothetical protein QM731_11370 [Chitinophagaceae bacterium]
MTEVLTSYLLQHKSLSIPGLGSLYIERIPAQTDFVNKRILPPDYHFRFDKYFDAPDKDFFSYLAQQNDMVDYEAIKWYNEWAYDLRNEIRNGNPVEWPGIGTLKKDISGEIIFEAIGGGIASSLEPAPATRVIRNRSQHTMLVGDREVTKEIVLDDENAVSDEETQTSGSKWWIYAIIIGVLSLAVIFFHFYSNGFSVSSTGNSNAVPIYK